MSALLAFLSFLIELAAGYPDWLLRLIGHPVIWIGRLITALDKALNRDRDPAQRRQLNGILALGALIAAGGVIGWLVEQICLSLPLGVALLAILASSLLAQRSLAHHVAAVATALEERGLPAGRLAVSQIVGRDPQSLDEAAVCRAAIESLSENFSDGVVAPGFWLAVAGLPGALIYKAVNTADSMIGHRSARHEAFGWASARFDDLINLPASRLTGLILVVAAWFLPGASAGNAWAALWRDAHKHRSPNAGWPEAAMAGALGLALAGPRSYGGKLVDDVFMGEGGRREATPADIRQALSLYWIADAILILFLLFATGLFMLHD